LTLSALICGKNDQVLLDPSLTAIRVDA